MRMNREQKITALDVLHTYTAEQLQKIFSEYGEVHNAKTAALKIVAERKSRDLQTSGQLREVLVSCMPHGGENQYLAKIFQALRIEVNDELGALKEMLMQCAEVLKPGGRLVVICLPFAGGQAGKEFLRDGNFEGPAGTDLFGNRMQATFRVISRKPVEAGEEEVRRNPRARSAK
jgi:16S rRNA (cytosine1402-N4)-methyltransferase